MLSLLIWLIVFICAAGIVYWFLQHVPIPAPFNYILYAVIAIIALLFLASLASGAAGGSISLPHFH